MPQGSHNPSLLRQVIEAALFREDKHYPPMAAHAAAAAERNGDLEAGKRFTLPVNDPDHLIPPNDKLLIFRALTGIDSVPALTSGGHLLRTAPNIGIHTRVVNNETKSARAYRIFSWMINICLGIQIVVAAAVTALGAASGPHSAVTAFGAINTVMAGILTYLRGSGLPDRLKAYQNKWKNIREYIEQREREFCLVDCDLDVQEQVFIVESMYQNVKSEMETTKSSGDGNSQQPDDPRIRRSLLPSSNELSIQRAAMRSSKYAEVPCPHHSHDDERGSSITAPKKTAEKP
jgi:hypothetical protein